MSSTYSKDFEQYVSFFIRDTKQDTSILLKELDKFEKAYQQYLRGKMSIDNFNSHKIDLIDVLVGVTKGVTDQIDYLDDIFEEERDAYSNFS